MPESREVRKKAHERQLIDDLSVWLRDHGREVRDVDYEGDPAPDGHAVIDGQAIAIEVGCGYADDPAELWRAQTTEVVNYYQSSSAAEVVAERRRVVVSRLPVLVASLQKALDDKCSHRHGRSVLLLDASHDEVPISVGADALTAALHVPAGCGFSAIYLVVPRFASPRDFVPLTRA